MRSFLFGAAALIATVPLAAAPLRVDDLKPGDPLPNIQGTTLDGKPFDLAKDMSGKVVLLDFWATWCGPCVQETPNILANYKLWHDKGFEVVAVSLDKAPELARDYAAKHQIPWTMICDGLAFRSPYAKALDIRAIPALVLVGRDGKVFANHARGTELTEQLRRAMTGPGTAAVGTATDFTPPPAFTPLMKALASGTEAESLAEFERLAEAGDTLENNAATCRFLASRYGWRPGAKIHAKTIFLLADKALSIPGTGSDTQVEAGAARAHAALELGGPYLAEVYLASMRQIQQEANPAVDSILLHQAYASRDAAPIAARLFKRVADGNAGYTEVRNQLKSLDDAGVTDSSGKLAGVRRWLQQQENLPADRMSIKREGDQFRVVYKPTGTPLASSLEISCVLRDATAETQACPMTFTPPDSYTVTLPAPKAAEPRWILVRDKSGRADTNVGDFWPLK